MFNKIKSLGTSEGRHNSMRRGRDAFDWLRFSKSGKSKSDRRQSSLFKPNLQKTHSQDECPQGRPRQLQQQQQKQQPQPQEDGYWSDTTVQHEQMYSRLYVHSCSTLSSNAETEDMEDPMILSASSSTSSSCSPSASTDKTSTTTRPRSSSINFQTHADARSFCKKVGWHLTIVRRDGNCLFRAISDQVHGAQIYHQKVRNKIVDYISSNQKEFMPFLALEKSSEFNQYCSRMRLDGAWGGNPEIFAAAHMYKCNIIIHQGPNSSITVDPDAGKANDTVPHKKRSLWKKRLHLKKKDIHLLFVNDHYDSLRSIKPVQLEKDKEQVIVPQPPTPQEQHQESEPAAEPKPTEEQVSSVKVTENKPENEEEEIIMTDSSTSVLKGDALKSTVSFTFSRKSSFVNISTDEEEANLVEEFPTVKQQQQQLPCIGSMIKKEDPTQDDEVIPIPYPTVYLPLRVRFHKGKMDERLLEISSVLPMAPKISYPLSIHFEKGQPIVVLA